MTRRDSLVLPMAIAATVAASAIGLGQDHDQAKGKARHRYGYKDTPMLPGGRWHVHDSDRPLPRVITPGTCSTQDQPGQAPSDAVVLFDGKDLSHWQNDRGQPARWTVQDGAIVARPGAGAIQTRDEFGDCQIHIEFASPNPPRGRDQNCGNSGVIIFGRYEIQVLDSFKNVTYADGQAAAIYGQYPPMVNASRPPGQWQTYDILFTAPRFKPDGSLESPAYSTVLHNGVVVHNHTAHFGPMVYRNSVPYKAHGPKGPIVLQEHGHPVRFRNLWVREIKGYDEP